MQQNYKPGSGSLIITAQRECNPGNRGGSGMLSGRWAPVHK